LLCVSLLLVFPNTSPVTGQGAASAPTLTVTVKGSAAYAQPTPVPLATALLVITPVWSDISAKTPVTGREASGQPLFLSDLAVVLSNKAMNCTTVFSSRQVATDQEFVIVAGLAEAYTGPQGYNNTSIGKGIVDTGNVVTLPVDRFSADAQFTVQKRKSSSKDNLRGSNGRLVLQRDNGAWTADVMVRADELVAEGKVSLTPCGIVERKKAAGVPLLGEKRLMRVVENYGM
jgi:hypothetical protein